MASYYYFVIGLFFCFFVLSTSTHGAACTGSGVTRAEAASHYADSCQLPVKDCDPLSGQWYCSSENIDASHFDTLAKIDNQAGANSVSVEPPAVLSSVTSQSCIDTDGDGWGWDGVASCQTGGQISAGNSGDLNSSVPAALNAPSNACVCLLYTSPSPRDLSTSRMPSSA